MVCVCVCETERAREREIMQKIKRRNEKSFWEQRVFNLLGWWSS